MRVFRRKLISLPGRKIDAKFHYLSNPSSVANFVFVFWNLSPGLSPPRPFPIFSNPYRPNIVSAKRQKKVRYGSYPLPSPCSLSLPFRISILPRPILPFIRLLAACANWGLGTVVRQDLDYFIFPLHPVPSHFIPLASQHSMLPRPRREL